MVGKKVSSHVVVNLNHKLFKFQRFHDVRCSKREIYERLKVILEKIYDELWKWYLSNMGEWIFLSKYPRKKPASQRAISSLCDILFMISTENGIFILFLAPLQDDINVEFSLQTRVIKCKFLTLKKQHTKLKFEISFTKKFVHLISLQLDLTWDLLWWWWNFKFSGWKFFLISLSSLCCMIMTLKACQIEFFGFLNEFRSPSAPAQSHHIEMAMRWWIFVNFISLRVVCGIAKICFGHFFDEWDIFMRLLAYHFDESCVIWREHAGLSSILILIIFFSSSSRNHCKIIFRLVNEWEFLIKEKNQIFTSYELSCHTVKR